MMKTLFVFLLLCTVAASQATVINFDVLPDNSATSNNQAITNQYQPQGARFISNGGQVARILSDAAEATSGEFILIGGSVLSNLFLTFVDPNSGLATTANNVSVNVISAGHSVWTVTAKDLQNQALETFVITNPSGPVSGLSNVDPINFTSNNIAAIDFVFTTLNISDGIGIDDLSFNLNSSSVPEPSSMILMGLALFFLAQKKLK